MNRNSFILKPVVLFMFAILIFSTTWAQTKTVTGVVKCIRRTRDWRLSGS
jgi:hypothetical protein